MDNDTKVYVGVVAVFKPDGHMTPLSITWEDGKEYEVDKILENRPTIDVMNPENVYIDPSCGGDMDKAMFIVVSFETLKLRNAALGAITLCTQGYIPRLNTSHQNTLPNPLGPKTRCPTHLVSQTARNQQLFLWPTIF